MAYLAGVYVAIGAAIGVVLLCVSLRWRSRAESDVSALRRNVIVLFDVGILAFAVSILPHKILRHGAGSDAPMTMLEYMADHPINYVVVILLTVAAVFMWLTIRSPSSGSSAKGKS